MPSRRGPRRRIDRGLLVASLAIAAGLVLAGLGVAVSITGDDRADYPSAVEAVDPVPDAVSVPPQTSVFVDLDQGYTGVLVINGVEIPTFRIGQAEVEPGRQVDVPPATIFEPGNATLTYTPSGDGPVARFEPGRQQVELIYWREDESRARAQSFGWLFNVL
ncbi:MAG: hypothetical protein WD225_02420 [Ilumatobacteraceae bacterium]